MIAVTGATGHLGQLVINGLLTKIPAQEIVASVRNPQKAQALSAKGVVVREADYSRPETLERAFAGVEKLLLISSSEIGQRVAQHKAVIQAAKAAGVKLLVYTSVLRAESSPLGLAEEHRQTETAIRESGIPYVFLRNGWYTENYTASIPPALQYGVFMGCAGDARISSATRQDYADAAVAVLTSKEDQSGRIYELAGDGDYTLTQFAEEIAKQSGKPLSYRNVSEEEYKGVLIGAGLPEPFAALIADSDTGASKGALFDDEHQLSRLIGRPTTPWEKTVAEAVKA